MKTSEILIGFDSIHTLVNPQPTSTPYKGKAVEKLPSGNFTGSKKDVGIASTNYNEENTLLLLSIEICILGKHWPILLLTLSMAMSFINSKIS